MGLSSYVVSMLATGALAAVAAAPAWRSITVYSDLARRARRAESQEYALRLCARISAAKKNFQEAAAWIAERDPPLARHAADSSARGIRALEGWYSAAATVAADAGGTCVVPWGALETSENPEKALAYLEAEGTADATSTRRRGAHWPNWAIRFQFPRHVPRR